MENRLIINQAMNEAAKPSIFNTGIFFLIKPFSLFAAQTIVLVKYASACGTNFYPFCKRIPMSREKCRAEDAVLGSNVCFTQVTINMIPKVRQMKTCSATFIIP